jgi:erythromycin esterase-like protein
MAENIDSIWKELKQPRMMVSGDNTHVSKSSGKMGSYLKDKYSDKYLSVGFTFQDGEYAAYGKERVYKVYPAYVGTYAYLQ